MEKFFERQVNEGEDSSQAFDRMAREIKGSIFTLLALFLLVALTSYIPLDSFNIFQGRFDHMNNLGGIVGALVGEWLLGTVGAPGYSIVILVAWIAINCFRGKALKENFFRVLGFVLGTVLAAIACFILMYDRVPEASLLQGGLVGKTLGTWLKLYFNTTGAMLLIAGGFVVTAILTTGFSVSRGIGALFNDRDDDEATEPGTRPRPTLVLASGPVKDGAAAKKAAPAPKKPPKKSRKKKSEEGEDLEALDEKTEEIDMGALIEGQSGEGGEEGEDGDGDASGPYEFEPLIPFSGAYDIPTARLLKNIPSDAKKLSRGEVKENAEKFIEHLLSFQITGDITRISQGPVLVTYEFKPTAGVKLSRIEALQDDLGVVMGTPQLRIVAPIPGKTTVGIEVPRPKPEVIPLKDVITDKQFQDKKLRLPVALGKTTDGDPVFSDLAAMPHLLVAGGTGSGKSVFVNSLIMGFMFRLTPQQVRMILIDPKMLELAAFSGIPHLVTDVITDNAVAFNALNWAVDEMERRYALMAETGSKNIDSYNEKQKGDKKLPFIVIVVDELADLMMSFGKMVEVPITRLAQKARAAGLHLVLATQRPSTDVVTGLIKANMPSRIAFKVPSGVDSRTVLDAGGAEGLMGRGDCLMIQPASPLRRLHGTFVTEEDLARVVKYVKGGRDHTKNYIQFPAADPPKK